MRIFKKKTTKEILFLMPVQSDGEKPPRSSIKMLYCDASGKVYTTTSRSLAVIGRSGNIFEAEKVCVTPSVWGPGCIS